MSARSDHTQLHKNSDLIYCGKCSGVLAVMSSTRINMLLGICFSRYPLGLGLNHGSKEIAPLLGKITEVQM